MTKPEFLSRLRRALSSLPPQDLEERLTFYREMIEDRMEEGMSEAESIESIGPIDEIITQITADMPSVPSAPSAIKPEKTARKRSVWLYVGLILGSPIWLSLLIAAFSVALSLYVSLWAILISLWAVCLSLGICALPGGIYGLFLLCTQHLIPGLSVISAALVCAGLCLFLTEGCTWLSKRLLSLHRKTLFKRRHV